MNVFNLMASLTLDTKGYYTALEGADARSRSVASSINKRIDGVKRSFTVGAAAMGTAIAAFGVASIKTGAQFDSSMSQVAATMGDKADDMIEYNGKTVNSMEALRDFAKEMGATTKFSATQSADALNYMALAGYDAEESMQMLPNVLNLAAAGNMELAQASDMVTDAQSALGLSTEETTEMVDKMAKASSNSNTSVSQLGEAYLTVGGTAKALRGGTTELSAALGVLADNGIKGAEGGTALRNVLLGIQGKKFNKTFAQLGVDAYDAQGKLRSLPDILADMNKAMEGMTEKEKTELINKTFNRQDLKSVNALLATSKDRWQDLSGAIDDSKDAAKKMAETQLDNLAGDITLLKSAFEGLQISVSEKLMPMARAFIQGLTKMIEYADILGPIILGLATSFGIFAVAINLSSIITAVTTSMAALNAVLLANPIGLLIALIAGVGVALVLLWKNSERFRTAVIALWEETKSRIGGVIDGIKAFIDGFSEKLSAAFKSVKKAVDGFRTSITNGIQKAIAVLQAARAKISSTMSKIKSIFSAVGNVIKALVLARFNQIKYNLTHPIEAAKNKIKNIVNAIKNFFPIKLGKILSFILPDINIGSKSKSVGGKTATAPTFSVNERRYAKAMNEPYMFDTPTFFAAGEAGDEMLYGRKALMNDIAEATSGNAGNVYNFYNTITVDGADDPEEFANRFLRKLKIQARST